MRPGWRLPPLPIAPTSREGGVEGWRGGWVKGENLREGGDKIIRPEGEHRPRRKEILRKLDSVVQELEGRGLKFRQTASLRIGYVADVLFKKERVIVLDTRNADPFAVRKLAAAGYKVFVIPEGKLTDDQIRGFCDEVERGIGR